MDSSLHSLLLRQLTRNELKQEVIPDLKQWQEFLGRVNRAYSEFDQERYLLERSLEISSREMKELNEKLETAQKVARMGYWYYNITNGKNVWSKELYQMFDLDFSEEAPSLDKLLKLVHEQDRPLLSNHIDHALSHGTSYEVELRIRNLTSKSRYHWYRLTGQPLKKIGNADVQQLITIILDINRRKIGDEEIKSLHQKLITSARRAGMADVATSILHNIGNTLNSARVSTNLIIENSKQPYFEKLARILEMIEKNRGNLADYFKHDEKGKLVPEYLTNLIKNLSQSQNAITYEAENLKNHIKQIEEITSWQKSLSGLPEVAEKIYLPEVIDLAIKMCGTNLEKKGISITKQFDDDLYIITDRSKLFQILLNLVHNAKEALLASNSEEKREMLFIVRKNSSMIDIIVQDNGIGISAENTKKMFTFGFTTKPTGHGFGLHSSALAAKELGGKLIGKSNGEMQGAQFILTLPQELSRKKKDSNHEE